MPAKNLAKAPAVNLTDCLRCKTPLVHLGSQEIRVGGTTGGWKLLFGEWAELGEEMVEFEFLGCPTCRMAELRFPPRSQPAAKTRA